MNMHVGILRGGSSNEYSYSLATGAELLKALPQETYTPHDIFIDRAGIWYRHGIPVLPTKALHGMDVVLNAVHGGIGEDGTIARFLNQQGIAYAGARPHIAHTTYNKHDLYTVLTRAHVPIPESILIQRDSGMDISDSVRTIFHTFAPPYILKPTTQGHSHGIRYASTIVDLMDVLADMVEEYESTLVQQYIPGMLVSTTVLDDFRREKSYVFPMTHSSWEDGSFTTLPHHFKNASILHQVPTPSLNYAAKAQLEELARTTHEALAIDHVSHIDMIHTPRGSYVIDVDTVPPLHGGASLPHALASVGSSTREYAEHLISLALNV